LFLTTFVVGNTQQDFDTLNKARLDIVVINSFAASETWSNSIVQKIEKQLREKYPNAYIHTRNFGVAEEHDAPSYFFSLRHAFHSLFGQQADHFFQRINWNDIFEGKIIPDVIIFLGNESFLFYQISCANIPKQWIDIPVIWTDVSDSVIEKNWPVLPNTDFSNLCPPENRVSTKVLILKEDLQQVPEINYQYIIDTVFHIDTIFKQDTSFVFERHNLTGTKTPPPAKESLELIKIDTIFQIDTIFVFERHYNLTGVKTPPLIKENLELIKTLYPKVNEIVFIDEGFYTTDYMRRKLEQEIPKTLPDVRFTSVKHLKNINTDSLFYLMTHPVKGKVFLTYSFNIDAYFSKYSENTIDSLFQHTKIAPVFSLTNRSKSENETFMVGGYYLEDDSIVTNTIALINKALAEKTVYTIPFREIKQGNVFLDKTIVDRLRMTKKAESLPHVVFYNLPLPFFKKYETHTMIGLITFAIIVAAVIFALRQRSYNKKLINGFYRYKNLYHNLQLIYNYSAIHFMLYEKDGSLHKSNLNENIQKFDYNEEFSCQNIFEAPFLTTRERAQLKTGHAIFKDIELKNINAKTFQFIVKPIDDKGFIFISIDTTPVSTEQKQKESLMDLLEFVFNTASIGLLFYDINTNKGYASSKWNVMMGNSNASFPPSYKNFRKDDRTIIQNFVRNIQFTESQQHLKREVLITQNGQENWFLLHIFNMPERKLIVELCIDITKQKQHEAKLEIAKQEAELMNAEMKEFLANISHEIRTPLNAIIGFSEILVDNQIPEDRYLFSKIIQTNNTLLIDIIENVLKLSEIDSGNVAKMQSRFDAIGILSNIAENALFRINKELVSVIKDFEEKEVWIDTNLVYFNLLITNLVLNALKFTQKGSITIGYKKEDERHVFYVKDTGIGISEASQASIFKRFYKVDTFTQGTGLGLALGKSIAEFLEGELTFESELGKGSTFYFKL
jgi:signal transduction histidine kinase